MAQIDDLKAALAANDSKIQQVEAKVADLEAKASAAPAPDSDLQPVIAQVQAQGAALDAILTPPAQPAVVEAQPAQ